MNLTRLFKTASNVHVAIDDTHRVFIGKPGKMKEADVVTFNVRRNGGTTNITLQDGGKIFIPSPLKSGPTAQFNGEKLEKLDANDKKLVSSLKIKGAGL